MVGRIFPVLNNGKEVPMVMSAGVCRCCVDPREHGFFVQHGLPFLNKFYMSRVKGGFIHKPSPTHDISTTGLMLVQMGVNPIFAFQGHRDCAAIRILFNTFGKDPRGYNNTEKEFRRSHREALDIMQNIAADLPPDQQLRILERICVLQSINNLLAFGEFGRKAGYEPVAYAYYSLTFPLSEPQPNDPSKIGMMIFDAERGAFIRSPVPNSNKGIRIIDLIDIETFSPRQKDRFQITKPVNLESVCVMRPSMRKPE